MYRDRLAQNRSRELVAAFLDDVIQQRGWWAARAAWVDDRGMQMDDWRVSSTAPAALDLLRQHHDRAESFEPGSRRYPEPVAVPVEQVEGTALFAEALSAVLVDELVVVDVAGVGLFDLRLMFAVDPALRLAPEGIEALRTGIALLPTVIRQEGERTALRLGALRDPLTGLLNRAGLDELAGRLPTDGRVRAVIYIDLDGFKEVNDAHGHAAGDEVLVDTANRLGDQLRPDDLVARLGGDEFVIVADAVHDEASVISLSQRILGAITGDVVLASEAVVAVAASAGVVLWPSGTTLRDTVVAADALMYEAKRIGGGIAMQDSSGRILVRDPLGGNAAPEEVERGRDPVRVLPLTALDERGTVGAYVVLRGELSTEPAERAADTVLAALARLDLAVADTLVIEPRGRGWARDGALGDFVDALRARLTGVTVTVLVESQPSALELRLTVDELRARGSALLALGGVGSVSGGDVWMIAQVAPTLLSLDSEAVLNLGRTTPPGAVARLAAALGAIVEAPLLVIEPPTALSDDELRDWGVTLVARPEPAP